MTAPVLFQFMPPLLPSEYAALTASIKAHGVQVPVLVDESGAIIDGHHRDQIAVELGIDCPREVRAGLTDAEKRTLAVTLNRDRRHLTRSQIQALIAESIKADPELSDRAHAQRVGVHHSTVGKVRSQVANLATCPSHDPGPTVYDLYDPEFERIDPATGEVLDMDEVEFMGIAADSTDEQFEVALAAARADGDLSRTSVAQHLTSATTGGGEAPVVAEPRKVTGLDGKQYTRPEPKPQRRRSLVDAAQDAAAELLRAAEKVERIYSDDRYPKNREQVAEVTRGYLSRTAEVIDRINSL